MNILDSSGWLEYFAGGKNARNFEKVIEAIDDLIVPTIILFEVFKKLMKERGEEIAIEYMTQMSQAEIVDMDLDVAIDAAYVNREHDLPMADAIILATARLYNATLWTQDSDFRKIKGVKYFKK